MLRDRFLLGILIGIGLLILLSVGFFVIRANRAGYTDDQSPAGVLHNYILALQKRDYQRAYSYLADGHKPSFVAFQGSFLANQGGEISNTPVEIGETVYDEKNQSAVVSMTLVRGGRGPLDDIYRDAQSARLVRQGSAWKLESLPYPYWGYDWMITITPEVQPPK